MKLLKGINRKLFLTLFLAGIFSVLMGLPYIMDLLADTLTEVDTSELMVLAAIQSVVTVLITLFIGFKLYKKVGFELPILEKWVGENNCNINLKSYILSSIGWGILAGGLIIGAEYIFYLLNSPLTLFTNSLPVWWKGIAAAFYGGILEELMMRFCLMTLIVWVIDKVIGLDNEQDRKVAVICAIILAAIIFGLTHLPATAALTTLTPLILIRAILLNGLGGLIFGYLYWKKGLESAIIAHFTTDITLHVLLVSLTRVITL